MNHPPTPTWPRLRLDFYSDAVLLSRRLDDGRQLAYPVAVQDVVAACTKQSLGSGLLPANTLFWKQNGQVTTLGIFVPARRWRVHTEKRTYRLPMPPLVFAGRGTAYQIFAVRKRPIGGNEPLYHAPCPNVHGNGTICRGNTPFPVCDASTIQAALALFMEGSLFNGDLAGDKCHSHPEDVRRLWDEVDGRKRFPRGELVSTQTQFRNLLR